MVTTIALLDDHPVVREALRKMLEGEKDFNIIGEAGNGLEAIKLVKDFRPDILICDLMVNGINGLEVTRRLSVQFPDTKVIILSMYGDDGYVHEAMHAGAKAYVLKESTAAELVRAVREVTAGRRYFSPPFSDRAIDAYIRRTEETALDAYDTLTGREREVLNYAAQGFTNAEIASKLFISRRTVEVHRANLMRKLGLSSQADLLRYAIRRGIIHPVPK